MAVGLAGAELSQVDVAGLGLAGLAGVGFVRAGLAGGLGLLAGIFFSETLRLSTSSIMVGFEAAVGLSRSF